MQRRSSVGDRASAAGVITLFVVGLTMTNVLPSYAAVGVGAVAGIGVGQLVKRWSRSHR
jgi:dolichol kinase